MADLEKARMKDVDYFMGTVVFAFDEVLEHLKVLMALLKASEEAAK